MTLNTDCSQINTGSRGDLVCIYDYYFEDDAKRIVGGRSTVHLTRWQAIKLSLMILIQVFKKKENCPFCYDSGIGDDTFYSEAEDIVDTACIHCKAGHKRIKMLGLSKSQRLETYYLDSGFDI